MTKVIKLKESDLHRIIKRVLNEQTEETVNPNDAYEKLKNLKVTTGTRYQDQLKFGNLTIKPINFHLLSRSDEPVELIKQNTSVGVIYQVKWKNNVIINFTPNKNQGYIPDSKYIQK